jgi:predicted amidohydrolase
MGDIEYNFGKVFKSIDMAKEKDADIVVFPELSTAGYLSQGIFLEAPEREQPYLSKLLEVSMGIHVVLGFVEETELGILHNSAIIVGDGSIIMGKAGGALQRCYRKCYLPTYGMFEETRWFDPGDRVPTFQIKLPSKGIVTTAIVICEDFWQPLPIRIACMRGAQFVNAISASPKTLKKPSQVDALLKARAIENATYVVFVNQVGSQDMVNFWGGSKIVGPDGSVLVEASEMQEDLVVGDLDLYALRKFREVNPMLRNEREQMIRDYLAAYKEMRAT